MNKDIDWAIQQVAPPSCKHVLMVLANRADRNHQCFPSLSSISSDTGLNRVTVTRCIMQLLELGLLLRTKRGIDSNLYTLPVGAPCNHPQLHHATTEHEGVVAPCNLSSCTTTLPVVAPCSTEPPIEPKGTQKGEGKDRELPPPAEIKITKDMRKWATENGVTVDLEIETEAMLDHYRGTGETRVEWIAVWRGWMRRSKRFKKSANGNGHNSGTIERRKSKEPDHLHRCEYCAIPHDWRCDLAEACGMKADVGCPEFASKYNGPPVVSVAGSEGNHG